MRLSLCENISACQKKNRTKKRGKKRILLGTKRKRQTANSLVSYRGEIVKSAVRFISLDLIVIINRHMQRLTSRISVQAPSPHGDWNVKRGIRVAPSRPDWSVDVSVLRRLCVSLVYARQLIDLTVVVIPIEDWTRELFRLGFSRERVYFEFLFYYYYRRSSVSLVFLLKFFQDGWGFTDLAAKPAPFRLSCHVASMEESRVTYRANKSFAVLRFSI